MFSKLKNAIVLYFLKRELKQALKRTRPGDDTVADMLSHEIQFREAGYTNLVAPWEA